MSDKLEVLYFSAPWCGPCKVFKPAFQEVMEKFSDVEVEYIDIDDQQIFASELGIRSVPTIIITDNDGKEVFRKSGVMPKNVLEDAITAAKN